MLGEISNEKKKKKKKRFTDLNYGRSAMLQNYLGKAVVLRLRKEPRTILTKIPVPSNISRRKEH